MIARACADGLSAEEKLELLAWLLRGIPEPKRTEARRTVLEELRKTFVTHGMLVPGWIQLGLTNGSARRVARLVFGTISGGSNHPGAIGANPYSTGE